MNMHAINLEVPQHINDLYRFRFLNFDAVVTLIRNA